MSCLSREFRVLHRPARYQFLLTCPRSPKKVGPWLNLPLARFSNLPKRLPSGTSRFVRPPLTWFGGHPTDVPTRARLRLHPGRVRCLVDQMHRLHPIVTDQGDDWCHVN
jgi:hypothetical protein